MTYGGTYRYYTKILARYGVEFSFVDTCEARGGPSARSGPRRGCCTSSPRPTRRCSSATSRSSRSSRTGRRDRRRGQHLRLALPAEAARARRGHRRPLDDEVPERPLRLGRRHRRREEQGARRVALLRPEQLGRDPLAHGLLARPARHQDARRAHGAPRGKRPRRSREHLAGHPKVAEGQLPRPPRPPAARAGEEADVGVRRDDLLRARLASRTPTRSWRSVRLCSLGESLGGVETLISHPATMTHASIPEEERNRLGVTPGLVRISVGHRGRRRPHRGPRPGVGGGALALAVLLFGALALSRARFVAASTRCNASSWPRSTGSAPTPAANLSRCPPS